MKAIITISAAFKRNVIVRRLLCSLLALTFLGVFFIAKSSSEVHVGLVEELSVSANGHSSDGPPNKLSKSYSLPDIDNYVNIPYFINSEEMTSTLVLNNNLPDVAQAEVTLFNRQGKSLKLPVFTLQPFNAERFDLAEFTSNAAGDFSSGNLQIFYRGPMMAITSQITVSSTSRRISFDSTESSMMDYHSSQLDGILWLPDSETRAWAALTNTAASAITVVAQAGPQKRTVTLGPRETQVIELRDFLAGGPDKFPAALLTLGHSGAPGALIATGFAYDEHKGFSTSLPFVDRSTIATKMLAGAHFKFGPTAFNAGFPWGTTFQAPLVLANSGNSTDLASVTVDYTLNGVPNRVDLGRIKVEAKQIKQLDLAQELSSRGLTGPVDDAGLQITYTGQPKSLIARLTSLDETGDFVFDTPIKDPLAGSFRLSGNYPWRLDGNYNTVVHLKNTTGKEVFAVVQIRYEGGSYNPDKIKLAPYQTVAVDIRKLRDAQERDIRGGVMPPDVMGGQVLWYEQTLDSLIGRAEIFAVAEGLSSSFSCGGAGTCGQSFRTAAMSPTSANKDAGNSGTFFTPTETDTDCFNAQLGPFTVTAPLTWSSTTPSVASVSSSGFVTCVGPGTTTILASWSTTVYACGNNCQSNPANPSAAGTLQVKPSVTSLTVSQPSTKNPVTGVAPADGTVTVTNTTIGFASATSSDLVAYFMSTDVQTTITATGVNPSSAASQLKWQVDRDTTDSVATGTPTLQPMGGTAKITPDKPGNFRLICYYDSNSSGTYNSGEELRVFRFAVVRATAQSGHFIRSTVSFSGSSSSVGTMNAMSLQLDILLEGGGSNRTIGTGKVVLGEVGNLSTDNFVVNYPVPVPTPPAPGNVSGTENENPGGATPMVDTVNVTMGNQPTGGSTPFRGNSMDTTLGSGSGGNGQLRRVTSLDDPGFGWDANHPTTLNLWGTTVNGNAFKEFVVGYSTSFPRNYVVFAVGNWTVSANGSRSGGIWTNSGSSVSIPGGTVTGTTLSAPLTITITSGTPQSGDASGIQILGLSFVREFRMDHTP